MIDGKGKRVMVLATHIDDGEFGCGGTIARELSNLYARVAGNQRGRVC